MTPLQSFNLIDRLTKAIAILDEHSKHNEGYNSYMMWNTHHKELRQLVFSALETAKNIEIVNKP